MNDEKRLKEYSSARLNTMITGCVSLTFFLVSTVICGMMLMAKMLQNGLLVTLKDSWPAVLGMIACESILFWAGIIMVYVTSVQLGIKMRIIGILCGWIPVVHIVTLLMIIKITAAEAIFEKRKLRLDKSRADEQICRTKYPLLMVHGVFFRDSKYLNYWGRIPGELKKNGATVYYGNHQSAASVQNSAKELADRIIQITEQTGCGKVNVIAHSKGGLDIKTAVACLGIGDKVASIVTVNTPHKGCEFADYLMSKAPDALKESVAGAYNSTLKRLGDTNPDFIAAVTDLTASGCSKINDLTNGYDYKGNGIYTAGIGSCMKKASGGAFPLNLSYRFVKLFDGYNDGLVGEASFPWGEDYRFLENKGKRGISHGDMIDLNRENIPGFDVREFYVQLVNDLKKRGL